MKRLLLALIRLYRQGISPGRVPCCRFTPTCSAYAYEAIESWGVVIGCALSLWRILRCNPLFRGGYDPVPQRIHTKNKR